MINIINRENLDDDITSEHSNKFRWWPPEFYKLNNLIFLQKIMSKVLKLQMNFSF